MDEHEYHLQLRQIALPVALQALLASSFAIVDQIMIGQLGEASIAGIGIGGSFGSIFWYGADSIIAAAGIMIAQYIGQKNDLGLRKTFYLTSFISVILAIAFLIPTELYSAKIASLYTTDPAVIAVASTYLSIYCLAFIPQALTSLFAVILRCLNKAVYPMLVTLFGVALNTALNYVLIFGHFGFPALGVTGAAIASLVSLTAICIVSFIVFILTAKHLNISMKFIISLDLAELKQYFIILVPMLITELMWVLGENIYSSMYGHLGTVALAASSISKTIVALIMGSLGGLAQAAAIMVGRCLGEANFDQAYRLAVKLMKTSALWSIGLGIAAIVISPFYVQMFNVSHSVRMTAILLLFLFALYAPIKTENMVLGNGILRAGGKTKYTMALNIFGTWCVGIPLGLICTYVFKLPVGYVYAIFSLEEVVRLVLCLIIFKKRIWIGQISV